MGFQPGPVYREILDTLLYARLDGRVVSVEDERELVEKKFLSG
jgi:tRNA nucleotidyltransferase (CCA-adding enzyme)